ncbi:MAG: MFS transporter [Deltaproteobacteria bacterium]|nr:MFS transporter [Deltaproteobacteria bacterium]MBW1921931.1 MFS transporter [Deltaproteobacteria bacterium]MBW2006478.1 MFS transporter [Deltaproteobacteria bacterium]MBW2101174.1 MFS transporter [Deltaproteobacteria bacterium]RLB34070.1 MAG: hypothetical protein DRH20_12565 [Deltaproteobacteria bacterium]
MKNTDPREPLSPREKRLLLITCFGHFMSHFNMLVFPAVVIPLSNRLHLDMAQVLGLSFWMYLLFGLMALPWGIIGDRVGAKSLMMLFFAGAGLSGLAAGYLLDSPPAFSATLAALGLFSAIYHPIGLGLIAKEMERVSIGMGYNGMFGNLGLAIAPLLAGLVTWIWGPRAAYLMVGIMNLAGIAMLARFPLSRSAPRQEDPDGTDNGLLGPFVILLAAMMLGGFVYRGGTVVLPAYFELKNQGIYTALAGVFGAGLSGNLVATTITSMIFLVGMLGQYTGGRAAERFDARRVYLIFHCVTIPAALLMSVVMDLPLVLSATVYFFFLLGMQPAENTLVAALTPRRFHHSAFGMKFVLTFGVGSLAVKAVGSIEKGWGIESVYPALGLVSVVLVATIFLLIRKTGDLKT